MANLAPTASSVDSRRQFLANLSAAVAANTVAAPAVQDGQAAQATVTFYTVSLYKDGKYLKTVEGAKSAHTAAGYCSAMKGNNRGIMPVITRHEVKVAMPVEQDRALANGLDVVCVKDSDLVGSDGLLGGSRHLGPVPAGNYVAYQPKGGPVMPAGRMRIVPANQEGAPHDGTFLTISTSDWKRLKGGAV